MVVQLKPPKARHAPAKKCRVTALIVAAHPPYKYFSLTGLMTAACKGLRPSSPVQMAMLAIQGYRRAECLSCAALPGCTHTDVSWQVIKAPERSVNRDQLMRWEGCPSCWSSVSLHAHLRFCEEDKQPYGGSNSSICGPYGESAPTSMVPDVAGMMCE